MNSIKYLLLSTLLSSSLALSGEHAPLDDDQIGDRGIEAKRKRQEEHHQDNEVMTSSEKRSKANSVDNELIRVGISSDSHLNDMLNSVSSAREMIRSRSFTPEQIFKIFEAMTRLEEDIFDKYNIDFQYLRLCHFSKLPKELVGEILSYIPYWEINRFRLVNRKFRDLISPSILNNDENIDPALFFVRMKFANGNSNKRYKERLDRCPQTMVGTLTLQGIDYHYKRSNPYKLTLEKFQNRQVRRVVLNSEGLGAYTKDSIAVLTKYDYLENLILKNYPFEVSDTIIKIIPSLMKLRYLWLLPSGSQKPITSVPSDDEKPYRLPPKLETLVVTPFYVGLIGCLAEHPHLRTLDFSEYFEPKKYPDDFKRALNLLPSLTTLKFNVSSSMVEELRHYPKLTHLKLTLEPEASLQPSSSFATLKTMNNLRCLEVDVCLSKDRLKENTDLVDFEVFRSMQNLSVLRYKLTSNISSMDSIIDNLYGKFNKFKESMDFVEAWFGIKFCNYIFYGQANQANLPGGNMQPLVGQNNNPANPQAFNPFVPQGANQVPQINVHAVIPVLEQVNPIWMVHVQANQNGHIPDPQGDDMADEMDVQEFMNNILAPDFR